MAHILQLRGCIQLASDATEDVHFVIVVILIVVIADTATETEKNKLNLAVLK